MRHLFIVLLIALLPLRGWVSDAMAADMLVSQVQAQQRAVGEAMAEHAHETGMKAHHGLEIAAQQLAGASANCADHPPGSGPDSHDGAAHCDSCSACQACHTVALSPAPVAVARVFNLGAVPRTAVAAFSSAEPALGQKPPIS
ncbi:MAG: hypothetical protein JWR74_1717 [Polaromonas sp.]|nr:hypothetical protein [Polaromonas sp.]